MVVTKPSLSTPAGRERMQERDEPTTLLVKALASATPEVTVEGGPGGDAGGPAGDVGSRATLGWPVKVATPADRTLVDIAARLSPPAGRATLHGLADPLDDARALLVLTRLLYRARCSAALHGVHGADRAVRALVPIGRRLRAAVEAAERAPAGSAEQCDLLQRVSRSAEELWVAIDDRGEGIRALITVADRGVRGVRDTRPTMPEGLGHWW